MLWLVIALLAVTVSPAAGHPGSGIVVTGDGTVYFTDVMNETIWALPPEGTLAPLQRNRWTHCLFLGDDGTLFYEREEPVDGVAPCSFWKITPDGDHVRLIAPESDRRKFAGAEFVVDDDEHVYYAHTERDATNQWRTRIMKRTPAGEVSVFTGAGAGPLYQDGPPEQATIRIVTAMARGPEGDIYFADRNHVRRVSPDGTVTTIATGLIDEHPADPPFRSGPRLNGKTKGRSSRIAGVVTAPPLRRLQGRFE